MTADPTCAEVQAAIRAGEAPDRALVHAASCPACAALLADDAVVGRFLAADASPTAGADLADRVVGRIRADRNPFPRWPSWARGVVVWLAIGLPATAMLAFKPRPDLASRADLVAVGVGWAVAGLVAARVALRPVHRPQVEAPGVWVAVALLIPVALGLTGTWGDDAPWLGPAVHCFSRGIALAGLVLAVLWLSERRSAPGPTWWAGASGLAAVSGGLMLHASCGILSATHLMVAHAGVGPALALAASIALLVRASGSGSASGG